MAKPTTPTSSKRIQIDKNNATMVIILAIMAFITVFSIFSCKSLLSQRSYQARVISAKQTALKQTKANNQAAIKLVDSYKAFVSASDNIIGGTSTGTGDKDGDNAKIILDALPSKYDFPALVASLEKILSNKSFTLIGFTGSDDEIKQSTQPTSTPTPVEIPIQVSAKGSFESTQELISIFEHSIRPIKVAKLSLTGNDSNLTVSVETRTYYQPEKVIQSTTKVVK